MEQAGPPRMRAPRRAQLRSGGDNDFV